MAFRVSPPLWPLLVLTSPLLVPFLFVKNRRFQKNRNQAHQVNLERMNQATPLELPELEYVDITVLSEWEFEEGFLGEVGVSYLLNTDRGSLLYDVGCGPSLPTLAHNAAKLGKSLDQVDALVISHLHPDHMGGMQALRSKQVMVPDELGDPKGKPCFLPDEAGAEGFAAEVVREPRLLPAGIASVGPLARSLFFFGWTEELALLARIKDKGLVVFTGCGHPTIEVILQMVQHLSNQPIHAIVGGLHFPITSGRASYKGIQVQMIMGTGKPPWQRITDDDLSNTIEVINAAEPEHVFLSAHDTCDHALARFENELKAETKVLKAGATYRLSA